MTVPAESWNLPEITDETVVRYRDNYSLAPEIDITRDMIRRHAELEYELTQTLLNSPASERRDVWISSYDRLYRDLPWLAVSSVRKGHALDLEYGHFLKLIPVGARTIDIGSGVGYLATYLTEHGRPCVATEITPQRGLREDSVLTWHETDGIHLEDFEPHGSYDAVVSTQVIEHFHPDDVEGHFRGAYTILRSGGRYVFNTPHAFLGPQDLSRVFRLDRPRFMHLKEYTHADLGEIAKRAGFSSVTAVYIPPSAIRRRLPLVLNSRLLYRYLTEMEQLLARTRLPPLLLRAMLFSGDVFMTAIK